MEFMNKLYKFTTEHWIVNTFICSFPVIWFTIVQTVGKQINLVDEDGKLYTFSLVIFWFCVGLSIIYYGLTSWSNSNNNRKQTKSRQLLEDILSSTNQICAKKLQRFSSYIRGDSKKYIENPFIEITKPKEQIIGLMDELNVCLHKITGIRRENIGISIIYRYDCDKKWDWYHKTNISSGLSINDIVDNENSAARQIIDGKTNIVFYPNKTIGIKEDRYLPDIKDKNTSCSGSILCKDISIVSDNAKNVRAVLSVTSYGTQLCEEDDKVTQKKLLDFILPSFETRIKIELCLDYIRTKHVNSMKLKKIS